MDVLAPALLAQIHGIQHVGTTALVPAKNWGGERSDLWRQLPQHSLSALFRKFCAASCDFIHMTPALNVTECKGWGREYVCAELWIGTTIPYEANRTRFVDLFPNDYDSYGHLIFPEEYANASL